MLHLNLLLQKHIDLYPDTMCAYDMPPCMSVFSVGAKYRAMSHNSCIRELIELIDKGNIQLDILSLRIIARKHKISGWQKYYLCSFFPWL